MALARFPWLVLLAWCASSDDDGLDSVSWYVPCRIEVAMDGDVYDMPFDAEASSLRAEAVALLRAIHATPSPALPRSFHCTPSQFD